MSRVLISGGAGFMGYHLAKKLEKEGFFIDLIDNLSRGKIDKDLACLLKKKRVKFYNLNINSKNFINLKKNKYNYIFHFAAIVGVRNVNQNPLDVLIKNVSLFEKIIDLAKQQKKLKRLVFTSSSEIYAGTLNRYGLKFPTPENTILSLNNLDDKRSTYMLSKIYGEAMCHHSNLPCTIVRPHNIYGPRMGFSHVIPELFKKVLNAKKNYLRVHSPNHKRTFCYVDDAMDMIIGLSKSKHSKNQTFNIGVDRGEIKIIDLGKLILTILNKKLRISPALITEGSPNRRCPSMKKYKKIIGNKKLTTLHDGLKYTIDWYLNNKKSKII